MNQIEPFSEPGTKTSAETSVISDAGCEKAKAALWLRKELEETVLYDRGHGYVSEEEMKKRYGR